MVISLNYLVRTTLFKFSLSLSLSLSIYLSISISISLNTFIYPIHFRFQCLYERKCQINHFIYQRMSQDNKAMIHTWQGLRIFYAYHIYLGFIFMKVINIFISKLSLGRQESIFFVVYIFRYSCICY